MFTYLKKKNTNSDDQRGGTIQFQLAMQGGYERCVNVTTFTASVKIKARAH